MKEEVHVHESEEEPVVGAVLEEVEEGHCVIGEAMDEQGLKLSLDIVEDYHCNSYLLVEGEGLRLAIDLLLEHCKKCCNKDWSEVLNQEDSFPRDLATQVLENQSDVCLRAVFLDGLSLIS